MSQARKGPLRGPFFFTPILSALGMLIVAMAVPTAAAQSGEYEVVFDPGGDSEVVIGSLTIDALGREDGYRFELADEPFGDYFLSMRPFRCISQEDKMLCHLSYPYENRRRIDSDDLTDLEYDLLFIARSATEYGINPWNGRYFRLRWEDDSIVGEMHETDLEILAAPPDAGNLRPLADSDMIPVEASSSQWAPRLLIRPGS